MTRTVVDLTARRTRSSAFATEEGERIRAVARRLGVAIVEADLPPDVRGLLAREEPPVSRSGCRILVNRYDFPARQRFTAARELGGYVLYRRGPGFSPPVVAVRAADIVEFAP